MVSMAAFLNYYRTLSSACFVDKLARKTPVNALFANLLGNTPALFVRQFARGHPAHFLNLLFCSYVMREGVESRMECEATGRAGAGTVQILINSWQIMRIGLGIAAGQHLKRRCVEPNFFWKPPSLTYLSEKSMFQSLIPFIWYNSQMCLNYLPNREWSSRGGIRTCAR